MGEGLRQDGVGGSGITEQWDLNYKGKQVDICQPENHDRHRKSSRSATLAVLPSFL